MRKTFQPHRSPAIVPSCCLAVLLVLAGIRSLHQEPRAAIAFQPASEETKSVEIPSVLWEPAPLRQQFSGLSDRTSSEGSADLLTVNSHTVKVSGTIKTSLADSFIEIGEEADLAHAFTELFALLIDMETELAEGDRFSLLVEKHYKAEQFLGYGRILMGRYERAASSARFEAFYFAAGKDDDGYYSLDGKNLDSLFLAAPLPAARVTSSFALKREHPILGKMRPHLGVDLAAPEGTPVLAAADGIVVFLGYNGGFGNQIVIEHAGGFRTHYGHLSGYLPDLKKGSNVRQEDVIGYVGSTGMATGPHLDYRLEHHGRFKNPFAEEHKIARDLAPPDLLRMQLSAEIYAMFMESESDNRVLAIRKLDLDSDASQLQGVL